MHDVEANGQPRLEQGFDYLSYPFGPRPRTFVDEENFLTTTNLQNVLRQVSVTAISAAAVTLVMVAGGLDLSVGGVVALSGVTAALLAGSDMPLWAAFLGGVAMGLVVGLVNGILVVGFRINSVIATLGTMSISRGAAQLLTDGSPVHDVPPDFRSLGSGFWGFAPIPVVLMLATVAIFVVIQRRTLLGKHAVAIGSNLEAARLAGIRINRVRVALFVISGAMAGFGGILVASRLNSGQPNAGMGFEFAVIVAAVLGGTSLSGGEGRVEGTLIGALIVGVLGNGLNLMGVRPFWQNVLEGVVLVVAVGFDLLLRRTRGGRGVTEGGSNPRAAATKPD